MGGVTNVVLPSCASCQCLIYFHYHARVSAHLWLCRGKVTVVADRTPIHPQPGGPVSLCTGPEEDPSGGHLSQASEQKECQGQRSWAKLAVVREVKCPQVPFLNPWQIVVGQGTVGGQTGTVEKSSLECRWGSVPQKRGTQLTGRPLPCFTPV